MSIRYFEILKDTSRKGNCIPSGRQLPRTPPLTDVKRRLDLSNDDLTVGCEGPHQDIEVDTRDNDDHDQNRTFDFSTHETKTESSAEPIEPNSMLKGMKGYQLTASDLEFIKRMKEEKLIKKYQGDLEDVQRLLKKETMALEMACDLKEKAQAELRKFPSCEDLTEWVKVVLQIASPATDLRDLDAKSLLALVTIENVRTAMDKKKIQLARMEEMVENKRKKEAEERGWHEKQIASEQLKLQGLMSRLSDLTSELAQQEELYKDLQTQLKTQEEIQVEAEDVAQEEMQSAKSQVKREGKEMKKGVKSTEKVKDAAKQQDKVKSAKNKHTDSKTVSQKTLHRTTLTEEQTKQKSEDAAVKTTKSGKASRGPPKEVKEQKSNSQDTPAVGGRRKPPGAMQTVAPQPKNQHQTKSGDAEAMSQAATSRSRRKPAVAAEDVAEEAQNAGLRRSRRIASRRSKV